MGETEGGDRQIGGEAARRALISTEGAESRREGGCAVPVETSKESLKREEGVPAPVQCQTSHVRGHV